MPASATFHNVLLSTTMLSRDHNAEDPIVLFSRSVLHRLCCPVQVDMSGAGGWLLHLGRLGTGSCDLWMGALHTSSRPVRVTIVSFTAGDCGKSTARLVSLPG